MISLSHDGELENTQLFDGAKSSRNFDRAGRAEV
jgi:hypothetical protein